MKSKVPNGLFIWPYNPHDWAVIAVFFAAYGTRMYLMHKNPETRNPSIGDYLGVLFISMAVAVPSYEVAIKKGMEIEYFYPILGVEILVAKDILDYFMLSPDGKKFVVELIKEIIKTFLGKIGFVKKE